MSYILDALKKSEARRDALNLSTELPVMTNQPPSTARRYALPSLLLAAALCAGWLIAQLQATQEITLTTTPTMEQVSPAPPPNTTQASYGKAVISEQPDPKSNLALSGREKGSNKTVLDNDTPVPLFSPISDKAQITRATPFQTDTADFIEPSTADSNILSIGELPNHIQQSLPGIVIQGHIYDNKPGSRMVIINGRVVKEKKTISNGLILEEITPDGVILSYRQHVFHMGVFDK